MGFGDIRSALHTPGGLVPKTTKQHEIEYVKSTLFTEQARLLIQPRKIVATSDESARDEWIDVDPISRPMKLRDGLLQDPEDFFGDKHKYGEIRLTYYRARWIDAAVIDYPKFIDMMWVWMGSVYSDLVKTLVEARKLEKTLREQFELSLDALEEERFKDCLQIATTCNAWSNEFVFRGGWGEMRDFWLAFVKELSIALGAIASNHPSAIRGTSYTDRRFGTNEPINTMFGRFADISMTMIELEALEAEPEFVGLPSGERFEELRLELIENFWRSMRMVLSI